MLALAAGQPDRAETLLRRAEALARAHDLREVLWRTLRLRAQNALARSGDEAQARILQEEAAGVFLEQADTLRQVGQSTRYRAQGGPVLHDLLLGALARGDAARVFHFQELVRGRLV